jgi:hypothetical protein
MMEFNRRHFLAQVATSVGGAWAASLAASAGAASEIMTPTLDIVDSQVHANKFRKSSFDHQLKLEAVVGAMDAMGVKGVVIDEYTFRDEAGHMQPGAYDARGSWIPQRPFSKLAFEHYPDRFRFLWRVDIQDPHLAS